jgi:predicted RNase H-like HicB family nuclease
MANHTYEVRAQWDEEAKVWIAESDDVPGLVAEADDIAVLIAKLRVLIPELLEENGVLPHANGQAVDFRLVANYEERISSRAT